MSDEMVFRFSIYFCPGIPNLPESWPVVSLEEDIKDIKYSTPTLNK